MKITKLSPLTEASYYILIALTSQLHGYGIMKEVEKLSSGRLKLAPGTLYGALSTLQEHGLITRKGNAGNRKKKEYLITPKGIALARHEIGRLTEMASNGIQNLARIEGGGSSEQG